MAQHSPISSPQLLAEEVARLARHRLGPTIDVLWFGSWPKGTAGPRADLDIAVGSSQPFPLSELAELRALLEDLPTLREIDLVDLHAVSTAFKDEIVRHGVRL